VRHQSEGEKIMSMGNGLRNVAAALSLASLAVAGPAAAQEVKIGAVLGLTGGLAAYAPAIVDAAQLAVKHVNDNGGVLDGRQLRLMVVDDQTNPQVSVDAARRLVSAEGVVAIIGPLGSGQVLAVAPSVTIPNGVPHLARRRVARSRAMRPSSPRNRLIAASSPPPAGATPRPWC
jgi:hypothetical protein